ncbi:Ribosomal biogenesis protein Gar2 [Penicillium argentinense]|uniref:Ribosomal biogenesis protein Gar2 n=1 Tax=Penicillium argentinense TaxID=1131581 RepID=A0A9W9F7V6_9EURO|nr:Ribosomal biogenesis protein Gar2 [Penicillium argentinense]KAJ5095232.1 Ribosomal biogenesis protein Gar2 [Penicillium argentinense]
MAPDKRDNKRKAPAVSEPPTKKTKKVEAKSAAAPKDAAPKSSLKKNEKGTAGNKNAKSDSNAKTNGQSVRQVKPRKRAADFLSDDEKEAAPSPAEKKTSNKKSKTAVSAGKKAAAKGKKVEQVAADSDEEDEDLALEPVASDDSEDDDGADQTNAIIKGFESSGSEDESSGDEDKHPKAVPEGPKSKNLEKKLRKQQKKNEVTPEEPGVIQLSRIPHGFYEHQMQAYFSQFGNITRLRLSRNKHSGASKHYAYIEFDSVSVAKIVAETMDNYLMYGHILKCKYVPAESLHPEIWKGANKRYKVIPWNKKEKTRTEMPYTPSTLDKKKKKMTTQMKSKSRKIQERDIDYDFPMPNFAPDPEPVKNSKAVETAETPAEEPEKAIEAPTPKEDTPKKTKKGKKVEETPKEIVTESPATEKKKAKKPSKKTKA